MVTDAGCRCGVFRGRFDGWIAAAAARV